MNLKEEIKRYAYELGADLVGFGSIDRCAAAPIMMSPQGLFPGAKTVVVMAIHHPDACIELGGEKHPQEIGPYSVQYLMNSRLDELSYRMACFIEDKGYGAIPIASSNIWRYNSYKELNAVFAPDVSNIYMPVVAGLADMGYNGLALTPEYGARNRFVTIISDLEVEADPLIPPGTLCDKCMLCRKHCPSAALSKEIDGDKILKVGDYEYRFANKNLWRCAWGEHFDLDLDLEIPEIVTEEVIIEKVREHGIRSGEMGQCLKFCVPKNRRSFDREYSKTPMRTCAVTVNEELESRALNDKLINDCFAKGVEYIAVCSAESLKNAGINLDTILPGAKSVVTLIRKRNEDAAGARKKYADQAFDGAVQYQLDSICYDLARNLDELGFRSLMTVERSGSHPDPVTPLGEAKRLENLLFEGEPGKWVFNFVYTRKSIPERFFKPKKEELAVLPAVYKRTATLTSELKAFAKEAGADLCGVAPASRIDKLAGDLKPYFEGEVYYDAADRSIRFTTYKPEITEVKRHVFNTADYLPGAKSVIVLALRYNQKVLEFATKPPAEAVGPYAFQSYVTRWQGTLSGVRLMKKLRDYGYKAVMTSDLMGLGSAVASPRGYIEDGFANRFEAVAAGLGGMTKAGRAFTPDFGIRQRFIAIITDAELTADKVMDIKADLCTSCEECCVSSCPSAALRGETVEFACEGVTFSFKKLDVNRCDWSKRYAIAGEEGFKFLGSHLDELPPEDGVTPEALGEALKKHDVIKKYRPVVCEPCVINCPYAQK